MLEYIKVMNTIGLIILIDQVSYKRINLCKIKYMYSFFIIILNLIGKTREKRPSRFSDPRDIVKNIQTHVQFIETTSKPESPKSENYPTKIPHNESSNFSTSSSSSDSSEYSRENRLRKSTRSSRKYTKYSRESDSDLEDGLGRSRERDPEIFSKRSDKSRSSRDHKNRSKDHYRSSHRSLSYYNYFRRSRSTDRYNDATKKRNSKDRYSNSSEKSSSKESSKYKR